MYVNIQGAAAKIVFLMIKVDTEQSEVHFISLVKSALWKNRPLPLRNIFSVCLGCAMPKLFPVL